MKSRVLTALPAFVAAYGGAMVYILASSGNQWLAIGATIGLVLIGWVLLLAGRATIGRRPLFGVYLMTGWIVALIAIGAGLTALFLWVGLRIPDWLTEGEVTDEIDEISKVLLGAATAFAAVLFTDDLDEGEGQLWPSTKTKDALSKAFEGKVSQGTSRYDAVYEDFVPQRSGGNEKAFSGWGLTSRVRRAQILGRTG